GEEALVGGLEKPETLARSLCAEAGIAFAEAGGEEPAGSDRHAERDRADEPGRGREGRKARVTIDGVDLSEVIRKALDVAKFFGSDGAFENADEQARRADEKARRVDEKLRRADERLRRVDEKLRGLDRIFEAGGDEDDDVEGEGGGDRHRITLDNIPAGLVKAIDCQARSSDIELFLTDSRLSVYAEGDEKPGVRITAGDSGVLEIRTSAGSREPGSLRIGVPVSVDSIALRTASGDIAVEDAAGDLELQTASGDIAVERCSGDLRVKTASGDIDLAGCSAAIEAESASGDITLSLDEQCDSASLSSKSGDLTLAHPEDFDAALRCATVSGDIEIDGEGVGSGSYRLGAGLAPVRLSTISGDIQIRKA
ncbi:DUF4097 domain-containing protein, partial [bacterium]|nr:DUF4097 domain-containing protein [bacterium]